MSDAREYPVSCNAQVELWEACHNEAHRFGGEYVKILAMTQSLFNYRIHVLHDKLSKDKES